MVTLLSRLTPRSCAIIDMDIPRNILVHDCDVIVHIKQVAQLGRGNVCQAQIQKHQKVQHLPTMCDSRMILAEHLSFLASLA